MGYPAAVSTTSAGNCVGGQARRPSDSALLRGVWESLSSLIGFQLHLPNRARPIAEVPVRSIC